MQLGHKRRRIDDSTFSELRNIVGLHRERQIDELKHQVSRLQYINQTLRNENSRYRLRQEEYSKCYKACKQYKKCYKALKEHKRKMKHEIETTKTRVTQLETQMKSMCTKEDLERQQLEAESRTQQLIREHELHIHNLSEEANDWRQEASELRRQFKEANQHLNELEPVNIDHVQLNDIQLLKLSDANMNAMAEPVKRMQFVKLVSTSDVNLYYKFVYIETSDGRIVDIEDIVRDVATVRKCIHRSLTSKNKAMVPGPDKVQEYISRLLDIGLTKADIQRKWNSKMIFRWTDGFGRQGDLRAKLSRDFLSSNHLYDEPLCPEILSKVQELRGPLIKGNDLSSKCLYCGGEASEDDHYMSRVRDGYINKYLDCAINLVPSCICHRAGKDTKNSPASPLVWWLDETGAIRKKNKHHPQNKLANFPERRAAIEKKLRAFHAFFEEFAPCLAEEYHTSSKKAIEVVLDATWDTLTTELMRFDMDDPKRFKGSTLIKNINEKFKASLYNDTHM